MNDIKEQFKVPSSEELKMLPLEIMGAIYKEGVKHLKYFSDTQKHFKNKEKRVKCFDTIYYETVLPKIIPILKEQKWKGKITVTCLPVVNQQ